MNMRIPLSSPDITEQEIDAVTAVLRTNTLSLGPKLEEFEDAFSAYHQMPFAVAVSSGTAALHLAIRALNLGPGDEVLVPSFTFIAVANAVRYEQAIPVFADIDPVTLNLDPASVEARITPRTRAIIIVHTFGIPAEMTALITLARRHNLAVIEDACEAIGATYRNQLVGAFGDISVFAFYPNKQMTTGEGGAAITRDPQLASRMRAMRNQGRYPSGDWLQHTELGFNYRLSEMACALGLVQLQRLPAILKVRSELAARYHQLLAPLAVTSDLSPGSLALERPPLSLDNRTLSWFVYVIRLAPGFPSGTRDLILDELQQSGIGCARYFAPIHQQPAYAGLSSDITSNLPFTESIARRTLALPFFNRLTLQQAEFVTEALSKALNRSRNQPLA